MFHLKYLVNSKFNINLPEIIEGPNIKYTKIVEKDDNREFNKYKSLNRDSFFCEENLFTYDLATLINYEAGHIQFPEPNIDDFIIANNISFVSTNSSNYDLERILIFDIYKEDALNPENYLVYNPNAQRGEETEHPLEKIYFSEYIKDKTK